MCGRRSRGVTCSSSALAYKKNIDDIRESPALDVIRLLGGRGAEVTYHDPFIPSFTEDGHRRTGVALTAEMLTKTDTTVIITDHTNIDYQLIVDHASVVVEPATRRPASSGPRRALCRCHRVPSWPPWGARDGHHPSPAPGRRCWSGPAVRAAQFGLITLPLNDPAYVQLAALERGGCAAARVSGRPPVPSALDTGRRWSPRVHRGMRGPDPRRAGGPGSHRRPRTPAKDCVLAPQPRCRRRGITTGTFPLWENVRPTSQGDPAAVGLLHGRLTWGDSDRVAIVGDGFAESNVRNDPTVRARPFRTGSGNTSGIVDFSEAVRDGARGRVHVHAGRGRRHGWAAAPNR